MVDFLGLKVKIQKLVWELEENTKQDECQWNFVDQTKWLKKTNLTVAKTPGALYNKIAKTYQT